MKRAGMKYNSHVVSMICCAVNEEPNALVLEYVDHGDLLQYLQKYKVFVSLKHWVIIICNGKRKMPKNYSSKYFDYRHFTNLNL